MGLRKNESFAPDPTLQDIIQCVQEQLPVDIIAFLGKMYFVRHPDVLADFTVIAGIGRSRIEAGPGRLAYIGTVRIGMAIILQNPVEYFQIDISYIPPHII